MQFSVRREFNPKGKWTVLPQSGLRVYLTCPRCHSEYPLIHKMCGMHLDVAEAIGDNARCHVCYDNMQDASMSEDVADCPSCHLECRTLDQIQDSLPHFSPSATDGRPRQRRTPRSQELLQRPCQACGSPKGLHIHHSDWNHDNNSPQNLMVLCEYCHMEAGKLGQRLFDKLLKRVGRNPDDRVQLRARSDEWYGSLHAHRMVRSIKL